MKLQERKPTGREKNEESIILLGQLREKLYNNSSSVARRTAFNLSWMQEDGLEILLEALFSRSPFHTKNAACYGLRNMHGRMKKIGREVLKKGADSDNTDIRDACRKAIGLLEQNPGKKPKPPTRQKEKKYEIREIRSKQKKPRRRISHTSPREQRYQSRTGFNRR